MPLHVIMVNSLELTSLIELMQAASLLVKEKSSFDLDTSKI